MPSEPFEISDAEFAAIRAAKEDLKRQFAARAVCNAFSYRNVGRDVDLLVDELVREEPDNPRGLPLYYPAHEFVVELYHNRGAFEPLAHMYAGANRWNGAFLDPFLDQLEQSGRADLIEKVCTSILRGARALFFYHRIEREHGGAYRVEQIKNEVLAGYDKGIAWMDRVGRVETGQKLREQREALAEERFAKLPPASDLRKIDETLFWELIGSARAAASDPVEQAVAIGEKLKAFKAPEIRRFAAIYARLMKQLYHWNVWALAYAARDGCSDDSFAEFRTWLILRGDPVLVALAIGDPTSAARLVPKDPDLADGTLLPIIDEAYLARSGKTIDLPATDLEKPKGKEWPEEEFEIWFPQLVRHYAA